MKFDSAVDLDENLFRLEHLFPNEPILIDTRQNVQKWPIMHEFIKDDVVRWDKLRVKWGHLRVDVADCTRQEFTDMPKTNMLFSEYIDYAQKYTETLGECSEKVLYLKDWHAMKHLTRKNSAWYTPFEGMREDWLNAYHDIKKKPQDYRFMYFGVDGSWTPLHTDVFYSYSWSTNLLGEKVWYLYPPSQKPYLHDTLGNLIFDIRNVDEKVFSQFHLAQPLKIIQKPGETLFVPSGWFHQVLNRGMTLSVNHNWFNAYNIKMVVQAFCGELKVVEKSIEDLRDVMEVDEFRETCEDLMKKHYGMDTAELLDILESVEQCLTKGGQKTGVDGVGVAVFQDSITFSLDQLREARALLAGDETV